MPVSGQTPEQRQNEQDAAVGIKRKPFEPDGAYFARATWHWKAEADRLRGAVMGVSERIAQAMADHENEHRYELENGSQSTGVEPYEASAEDFEEIAAFVANRLRGAVGPSEDGS